MIYERKELLGHHESSLIMKETEWDNKKWKWVQR